MNGMTTVNTFIHYPSLSCARVMHFPSAFHLAKKEEKSTQELWLGQPLDMMLMKTVLIFSYQVGWIQLNLPLISLSKERGRVWDRRKGGGVYMYMCSTYSCKEADTAIQRTRYHHPPCLLQASTLYPVNLTKHSLIPSLTALGHGTEK